MCAGASVSKGLWYAFTAECLLENQRETDTETEKGKMERDPPHGAAS